VNLKCEFFTDFPNETALEAACYSFRQYKTGKLAKPSAVAVGSVPF